MRNPLPRDTTFSLKGREYYAAAERAHLFAADNTKALQTQLANLAATLQDASSDAALHLRTLLFGGVIATLIVAAAAAWFQFMRARLIRAQAEVQEAHQALMRASRQAGMAEVASSVLHNVGNVLNSVNVSANLLDERMRTPGRPDSPESPRCSKSKAINLGPSLRMTTVGNDFPVTLHSSLPSSWPIASVGTQGVGITGQEHRAHQGHCQDAADLCDASAVWWRGWLSRIW